MAEMTIDGRKYIERAQWIPFEFSFTAAGQLLQSQRVQFPGTAPFLLKALNRTTIKSGVGDVTSTARFSFGFGNSDGNVNYTVPQMGNTSGRVIDTSLFGNSAALPGLIIPYVLFAPNGTLNYEAEDLQTVAFPYTVKVTLVGSILILKG